MLFAMKGKISKLNNMSVLMDIFGSKEDSNPFRATSAPASTTKPNALRRRRPGSAALSCSSSGRIGPLRGIGSG